MANPPSPQCTPPRGKHVLNTQPCRPSRSSQSGRKGDARPSPACRGVSFCCPHGPEHPLGPALRSTCHVWPRGQTVMPPFPTTCNCLTTNPLPAMPNLHPPLLFPSHSFTPRPPLTPSSQPYLPYPFRDQETEQDQVHLTAHGQDVLGAPGTADDALWAPSMCHQNPQYCSQTSGVRGGGQDGETEGAGDRMVQVDDDDGLLRGRDTGRGGGQWATPGGLRGRGWAGGRRRGAGGGGGRGGGGGGRVGAAGCTRGQKGCGMG